MCYSYIFHAISRYFIRFLTPISRPQLSSPGLDHRVTGRIDLGWIPTWHPPPAPTTSPRRRWPPRGPRSWSWGPAPEVGTLEATVVVGQVTGGSIYVGKPSYNML